MRFRVRFKLEKENIPKDKNRFILSFFKSAFSSYDFGYYKSLYEEDKIKQKSFTFSVYLPEAEFTRDEIIIKSKTFDLDYSAYEDYDALMFYNSILNILNKRVYLKNNSITAIRLIKLDEKEITSDSVIFKTISPISVREHEGDNKNTWYHSLDTRKGQNIFYKNIKCQAISQFGEGIEKDLKDTKIKIIKNKIVKVKHYDIAIPANLAVFRMEAKPYLLDYFYKAGICSQRSTGFGMLNVIEMEG